MNDDSWLLRMFSPFGSAWEFLLVIKKNSGGGAQIFISPISKFSLATALSSEHTSHLLNFSHIFILNIITKHTRSKVTFLNPRNAESIPSVFYRFITSKRRNGGRFHQLFMHSFLCTQIPKVQKRLTAWLHFYTFGICTRKVENKTLVKLTSDELSSTK